MFNDQKKYNFVAEIHFSFNMSAYFWSLECLLVIKSLGTVEELLASKEKQKS